MAARRVVVPLLVLGLAAMIWLWPFGAEAPIGVSGETMACMARLREVYAALLVYKTRTGHAPTASGGDFLKALFAEHVWEDTPENRERLLCPGTGTPYAARDAAAFPLAQFPSGGPAIEPLAACDGGSRLPHEEGVNVLYSDGSVQTILLEQEIEHGRLPPGSTSIPIGPDSPIPDLRKLAD